MVLIILGLFVAGVVLFFLYGSAWFFLDKLRYRLPPGPIPVPFIGNFASLDLKAKEKSWHGFQKLAKKHGPVYTFYFGQIRGVVLSDSQLIHETLVTNGKVFSWRMDTFMPGFKGLNQGIVSANYDLWRRNRRFGMRAMRDFGMGKEKIVTNIQDELAQFLPELSQRCGEPFDPRRLLTNTVSNVICSFVFGKRFHYDDNYFQSLLAKIEAAVTTPVHYSAIFFALPLLRFFQEPRQVKDFQAIQRLVTNMVAETIKEHRLDYDPENIRDFPDLFIQAEGQEDAMELRDFGFIMTDMFIAGTETTSTALNWTLLYLATWPDIQNKCHELIDSVIDTDRLPSLADKQKLVYIDAVMCEVLRHSSLVPASLYHSNLETPAKIAGYDVPPYTLVVYNVSALNYDTSYWENPEKFNPDRWISSDGKLLSHSTHFMPFGLGPRVCLGESLARVEYFLFITAMLHRFHFQLKRAVDFRYGGEGIVHTPPDSEIIANLR